jgi:hypothetical protein
MAGTLTTTVMPIAAMAGTMGNLMAMGATPIRAIAIRDTHNLVQVTRSRVQLISNQATAIRQQKKRFR